MSLSLDQTFFQYFDVSLKLQLTNNYFRDETFSFLRDQTLTFIKPDLVMPMSWYLGSFDFSPNYRGETVDCLFIWRSMFAVNFFGEYTRWWE